MNKFKYLLLFFSLVTAICLTFFYPKDKIFDFFTHFLHDEITKEKSKVQTKFSLDIPDSKTDLKPIQLFSNSRPSLISNSVATLFLKHTWLRPLPPVVQSVVAPPQLQQAQPTSAPNMPFVYLGKYADGIQQFIIFSRGNRVFTVIQGDLLDNQYRLEKIDANSAQLTYLPLGIQQTISTGSFQ